MSKDTDFVTDVDITDELIKRGLWVDRDYVPDELISDHTEWFMAGITDKEIIDEAIKRGLLVICRV